MAKVSSIIPIQKKKKMFQSMRCVEQCAKICGGHVASHELVTMLVSFLSSSPSCLSLDKRS